MRLFSVLSIFCIGIVFGNSNIDVCSNMHFSGLVGTISSPKFPNGYDNNLDCYSYISAQSPQTVSIKFLAFYTQPGNDWVTITCESGKAFTSPRYTGSLNVPDLTIFSCKQVKVSFHTDGFVSSIGFSLAYNITKGDTLDFEVRLNNSFSSSPKEGRLEIYYSKRWGTVCDDGFTNDSARVTCASLGFGNIGAVIGNRHGRGADPIWLDNVNCTGKETGIEQCAHNGWGAHNCIHYQDVSISCDCGVRNFSGPTGTISSPNFPMKYSNYLDCYNYIKVPTGQTLIITFLTFNTELLNDVVTIACESGKAFSPLRYSGTFFPAVLAIPSCNIVKVSFHTDGYTTDMGFSLTYNITSDTVTGGITTKPLSAFPRSDGNYPIIFNCSTTTKYLPWWTISIKDLYNYTLSNTTCGVITSAHYSSLFRTESLGPGSCNLIANEIGFYYRDSPSGSVICTDATLSSATAIMAPINPRLRLTKGLNSSATSTATLKDDDMRISCNPSFTDQYLSLPVAFTYFLYSGGPFVQIRMLRTYWTSGGNIVPGIDTSTTSSYVMAKSPKDGFGPNYTCNIVCDFFSNISNMQANPAIEISFNTETVDVSNCGIRNFARPSGEISSPNFPMAYANGLDCYNYFDVTPGHGVIITFLTFNTHAPSDWVVIICESGNAFRSPLYSGFNLPPDLTISSCNRVNVYFHTDDSNTERGFSLTYNITSVLEDQNKTPPNLLVFILLGGAALAIIILMAILLRRIFQQKERNFDVGHVKTSNEHELQQRKGGDRNLYGTGLKNGADVDDPDYDKLDEIGRRLPTIPSIYDELLNHDNEQKGECHIYNIASGDDIDDDETDYDYPNASQCRPQNIVSVSCDEQEFDK